LAATCVGKTPGRSEGLERVQLPRVLNDQRGSTWDIQADGSIGDGGNDLYDGGSQLFLDGQEQFQNGSGQAAFDPSRNEVIVGPISIRSLRVTRRIAVDAPNSFIRYAEVLENPANQPVRVQLRVYFNMGGCVQNVQPFTEERGPKRQIGLAVGDGNNSLAILGAGRGARIVPRFAPQMGSDNVDLFYDVEIPARQTALIVHVEARRANIAECVDFLERAKERDLLKSLPRELTGRLANFRGASQLAGDLDVLRGEMTDVIELRGGDAYRGTIKVEKFRLKTTFGWVELPAQRIIGLVNVGDFRPRQLLITQDGEIFGGELESRQLPIELTGGQALAVPLSQIARASYRKGPHEPEEWTFDKPMVVLRSGDRMIVQPPARPLEVVTRYGLLKLPVDVVASAVLASEEHGVHEIMLTDGSRFSGLVAGDSFEMKLAIGGQAVRVAAAGIARLRLAGRTSEPDDALASLSLANGDTLAGTITGTLKLDTAFSTLNLASGEIRRLARGKGSVQDVQVTLWDQTTVSGQLQEPDLHCKLACGVEMKVPVALVDEYVQPRPSPSAAATRAIEKLAADLNADDWQVRDEAQKKLTDMGPVVIGALKQLRPRQSPEGQQRIDQIVQAVEAAERR
jgi:hypothetical protein